MSREKRIGRSWSRQIEGFCFLVRLSSVFWGRSVLDYLFLSPSPSFPVLPSSLLFSFCLARLVLVLHSFVATSTSLWISFL